MMKNILLCGVGGQGTVLASKILARSAISRGESAHTAETIGMAQRGGSVVSHVRIGENAYSPLIPRGHADLMIAFEPAEAVRNLAYLKKGGALVVNSAAVKPVTDSLAKTSYDPSEMLDFLKKQDIDLTIVDGAAIVRELGSAKSLNIALLSAAAEKGVAGITPDEIADIVKTTMKPEFCAANLKAIEIGISSVQ